MHGGSLEGGGRGEKVENATLQRFSNRQSGVCSAGLGAGVGACLGAGVLVGAKIEKLQPISVAGNPVGQCLSSVRSVGVLSLV